MKGKKQPSLRNQHKNDMKRFAIYWIVLIPLEILFVFALSYTKISSAVRFTLIVVFGVVFCLACEVVRYLISLARKNKPEKPDPFAD